MMMMMIATLHFYCFKLLLLLLARQVLDNNKISRIASFPAFIPRLDVFF